MGMSDNVLQKQEPNNNEMQEIKKKQYFHQRSDE